MKRLRTIRGFVRLLVALFMVAQFAGVVSSPRAAAEPAPPELAVHEHMHPDDAEQSQDHADHYPGGHEHGDGSHEHSGHSSDACCALHAYFVGMISSVVGIATEMRVGETLVAGLVHQEPSLSPGRLDRPPRPRR
jgi:hypothetical protein